jgi:hypothetical protein
VDLVMAKTSTKSVREATTAEMTAVVETSTAEKENVEEAIVKESVSDKVVVEPLKDSDEIEIMSLIPNVSYEDSKTGDMYEWEEVGHIELMTFEMLKNLWRNYKGYFKNMWLKPLDKRVIEKFALTKTFEKYEYLMNGSNYTRKNIKDICSAISNTPNALKHSIVNKIKDLIVTGELADIMVIREIEKYFNLDLVSFLN